MDGKKRLIGGKREKTNISVRRCGSGSTGGTESKRRGGNGALAVIVAITSWALAVCEL